MDDGEHTSPTKKNIVDAFEMITKYSQPGDVVFISFAGHGGRVEDISGDEEDGFDETLIPVDFASAGQIVDDDILELLVKPMRKGVTTTVLIDCCHSGTVMDLPYTFGANDNDMRRENGFNFQDGTGPIDLEDDKPKKRPKTPEEEEKREKQKQKKEKKKKKNQSKSGNEQPPEEYRHAPISDIKRPQKRPNSEPAPAPPKDCCQTCVIL